MYTRNTYDIINHEQFAYQLKYFKKIITYIKDKLYRPNITIKIQVKVRRVLLNNINTNENRVNDVLLGTTNDSSILEQ